MLLKVSFANTLYFTVSAKTATDCYIPQKYFLTYISCVVLVPKLPLLWINGKNELVDYLRHQQYVNRTAVVDNMIIMQCAVHTKCSEAIMRAAKQTLSLYDCEWQYLIFSIK